jgi:hypothetical protein
MKATRALLFTSLSLAALGVACAVPADPSATSSEASSTSAPLVPVGANALCVTEGTLANHGSQSAVSGPRMRAVASYASEPVGEVRFTYNGDTSEEVLSSGIALWQVALKLRAADDCNLIYVRWILAPAAQISVEVKSNPGMSESSECGAGGYEEVQGTTLAGPPEVDVGTTHVLRADAYGRKVNVWADGVLAWQGTLPSEAAKMAGPTGIRTDNVMVDFELLAAAPEGGAAPSCGDGAAVAWMGSD